MRKTLPFLTLGVLATGAYAVACDHGPTTPNAGAMVELRFLAGSSPGTAGAIRAASADDPLVIAGPNGELDITGVRFIVSELELRREEAVCDMADGERDHGASAQDDDGHEGASDEHEGCEELHTAPLFVDLPLSGESALTVEHEVPPGTYDALRFKIEDLEHDEHDDGDHGQQLDDLLTTIRADFPDWPTRASLMVTGSFTPTNGEPHAFTAFFRAEIVMRMRFDPPFTITGTDASRTVSVAVDPALWFTHEDGTVLDLSQFDFGITAEVRELEVELGRGFGHVEHDHD